MSSPRRPIPLIWRRSGSLGAEEAMDSPGALARRLAFLQLERADPEFHQHVLEPARIAREQTHQLLNAAIEHGKLRRWDTRTLQRRSRWRHPGKEMTVMQIGLDIADLASGVRSRAPQAALGDIARAEAAGLNTAWVPVLGGGPDPVAVCALAAGAGRRIELAAGVVRIWGQHPVELARAAFSVAQAAAGGFVLGVGVSHRAVAERTYGSRFDAPADSMAEYLTVLRSLVDTGAVEFSGQTIRCAAELDRPADPGRVRLGAAAGGPRMLAVAGAAADVVITNMAGPHLLATRVLPVVQSAAARAGRPQPRIAAVFSICATSEPARARAHIDEILADYARMPAYREQLAAEAASSPGDIALVGDETQLATRLEELAALGVTDLIASIKAARAADEDRTRAFLSAMAAQ